MRILGLLSLLCVLSSGVTAETIAVNPNKHAGRIDPLLYGQFLEHIYDSVVNGLWGQLIRGPSFEEPPQNLGSEWNSPKGNWRLEDADLVSEFSGMDAQITTGLPSWSGYVFSVDARKVSGAEGFLVLFAAADADNFYWWNLGGWGNRYSGVEREVNGSRSFVEGTRTETRIEPDRWYRIEIALQGRHVTCSLDGRVVTSFDSPVDLHGFVGLGSWSTDVRYRGARVTSGSAVLFEMKGLPPAASTLSGAWRCDKDRDGFRTEWSSADPLNSARCQRLVAGAHGGAIAQDGLCVEAGVKYIGSLWLRGSGDVTVGLRAGDELQEQHFSVAGDNWTEEPLTFVPDASSPDAALTIGLNGEGDVYVDQCTLQRADSPYRPFIVNPIRDLRPAFIRWPGGCYAEHYRWKDGIGPRHARVTRPNVAWGGLDPNGFGTLEFLELCEELSSEPVLVLNIGQHDDPARAPDYVQEALDWFDYCNGDASTEFGALRAAHGRPEPFRVRYWEAGNESWGMGVQAYAERLRLFASALRARDASVKILACGSGGLDQEWNRALVESAAENMDYLSVHRYMEGTFAEEMQDGLAYPAFLRKTADLIAASKNPEIKIAVTEWNQQSIRLRSGLYAGLVLNGFERLGDTIAMSCPALFVRNVDAPAWNNALINHDGCASFVAPNYLVVKMYRDNFAPVRVECDSPESLNVVATWDSATDDVILKVVNPSETQDISADIAIRGRTTLQFRQWTVWSPSIDDENSIADPKKIAVQTSLTVPPIRFPAHSVVVLRSVTGWEGKPLDEITSDAL